MNIGRINRINGAYNVNGVYGEKNVNNIGAAGSSADDSRPRAVPAAQSGIAARVNESVPRESGSGETGLRNNDSLVYTNSDGDRAEISGKAIELWRGSRSENDTSPAQPFSRQTAIHTAFERDLDLPSPFLNWEEIINGSDLPPVPQFKSAPESAPPAIMPQGAETPNSAIPQAAFPGGAQPQGAAPDMRLPGIDNGSVKFDTVEQRGECKTCESRRYVDQSDDPSVSFQTPTKISPNMALSAVTSHENEHVRNEQSKARRDGREIISQTVTLSYDICPECGRHYVSGGTTRTTSISRPDSEKELNQ